MNDLHQKVNTLKELRENGWQSISVKEEIRKNLIKAMQEGSPFFEGIHGYEKTVLPQIQHALLSKHDMILLGLRGQAKTKMLRMLVNFLDEYMPIVAGSEINDDPFRPLSIYAKKLIGEKGDDTPIDWVHRSKRYGEKLATPDTTVADLIGDIDPIKAATKKISLSDENAINFGLIPRTNRGIFVINELPDLQPRIQVALLNIMQERDIQIRGFHVRIPLDVSLAFSANPEDYTNRGNIITPLKDRIDAQIITHYPKEMETGINITRQEAWDERGNQISVHIPEVYREIIEQAAFEARNSEYVDQKSGVSTRMTITAMEQAISSAERRAVLNGEQETVLRISDIYHMVPALTGKLELVYEGEQEGVISVAKHIIGKAISTIFKKYFIDPQSRAEKERSTYKPITEWFSNGNEVNLPDVSSDKEYQKELAKVSGLKQLAVNGRAKNSKLEEFAWMDFMLDALHQHSMLSKEDLDDHTSYSDMVGTMFSSFSDLSDEDFSNYDI
ncbi:MAG: magnesium chelatase [Balneola sp.]|nr:MAG: magnesium chelatase [Balneola sp.]